MTTGGATGSAIITALYLLYRVMRNPRQLGRWLPSVRTGRQEGMLESDEARRLRKQHEVMVQLSAAPEQPSHLEVVEIELKGVDNPTPEFEDGDPSGMSTVTG